MHSGRDRVLKLVTCRQTAGPSGHNSLSGALDAFFPQTAHSKESSWKLSCWKELGPQHPTAITYDPRDRALRTRAWREWNWPGKHSQQRPGMRGEDRAEPPSKILLGGKSFLFGFFSKGSGIQFHIHPFSLAYLFMTLESSLPYLGKQMASTESSKQRSHLSV